MRVVVIGDEELVAKIEKFRRSSDLENAYGKGGRTVAGIAERLVPVGKTHKLINSIRYRTLTQKAVIQAGTRGFPYAPIVHYGKMPGWTAQPFLTNALKIADGRIPYIFNAEVKKALQLADL